MHDHLQEFACELSSSFPRARVEGGPDPQLMTSDCWDCQDLSAKFQIVHLSLVLQYLRLG